MSKIAVIGSGVVGQATGKGFATKGHDVTFVDINPAIINNLKKEGHKACFPDSLKEGDADTFFLILPTPTVDGKIKLDFLKSAAKNLGEGALKDKKEYSTVVVRSTVPPNTTESIIIPILEKYSGKKAGKDFGVCMNPEYLREKTNLDDFFNPWIIVIGCLNDKSRKTLEEIYKPFNCPISYTSLKEAETQKYIHNIFNACKISFFNEMRMVCEEIDINTDKVFELVAKSAEGSWNHKYGIKNMGPYGGTCLPKDTVAFLDWFKKEIKTVPSMDLLEGTIKVNELVKERQKI